MQYHGAFHLLLVQNHATIPLLNYTIKHLEKEINQFMKEEQIMVCSSPF